MSLRPNGRMEARKRVGYKVSVDKDEARRRREGNAIEIRKNKREEGLFKKRREAAHNPLPNNLETLSSLATSVMSQDTALQLHSATQFRKLSALERDPEIGEIIKTGVVARFVDFLRREDTPQLQFEAAWILTNIASGSSEQTSVVIECGAVPLLVQLLCSPNDDLREQVVWALANIAGDSSKHRDLILGNGAMKNLLAQFNEHARISMLRNATWALLNLCRGKPPPPFEQAKDALSTLERLLQMDDEEILSDACWALSYFSDGNDDNIQAVIEAGVLPKLVKLLQHSSQNVLIPALRTIGNIATGNDVQTQYIIDSQALPRLLSLITKDQKLSIKREICWTISNITAGNTSQIQAVIDANIIPPLLYLLANAEFDIKREAAWAITNATACGTHEQIKYLVNHGCVKPLCDLLPCPDTRVVTVCLEGLENILKAWDGGHNNEYASLLEDAGGLDKIEALQEHENTDLYGKAVRILENYLVNEEGCNPTGG
ncbi:hypothetical protein SUGI_1175350 [Cryptomeria japonica]|uniref:importin subunit alpha isoform X2 n=1 Tax=Cryptomeria japonica TaxID=3369 RepID=UPI002414AFA0|nr:importin subunit alpha isoform X2 [Cryptomeria japonica]GLJ54715.1 hypothetical protein SUGI_1175350 [Cryptomeria japonica]